MSKIIMSANSIVALLRATLSLKLNIYKPILIVAALCFSLPSSATSLDLYSNNIDQYLADNSQTTFNINLSQLSGKVINSAVFSISFLDDLDSRNVGFWNNTNHYYDDYESVSVFAGGNNFQPSSQYYNYAGYNFANGTYYYGEGYHGWFGGSATVTDWLINNPSAAYLGVTLNSFGDSLLKQWFLRVDYSEPSNPSSPSAVPLPAALPLMLSGLGVLGFASRRRKESV